MENSNNADSNFDKDKEYILTEADLENQYMAWKHPYKSRAYKVQVTDLVPNNFAKNYGDSYQ